VSGGCQLYAGRRYEIRIAGFGGQGVITVGKILGTAFSVFEGKNSVNTQSYGPESRGGACRSEVVVSDGQINYPYVREADVLVALSRLAFETYIPDLKKNGILLVDSRSITDIPDQDQYRVYKVPTAAIASETGGVKFQNVVALGALYYLIRDHLEESSLREAIEENLPPETRDVNLAAFTKGIQYVKELDATGNAHGHAI
jgi:2-oxoglutarate ferredoxin oxidoreductase subunit gamma